VASERALVFPRRALTPCAFSQDTVATLFPALASALCARSACPFPSGRLDPTTEPLSLSCTLASAVVYPSVAMLTTSCTSEVSQSHHASTSAAAAHLGSQPAMADMPSGVPWPEAVKLVVHRAVGVAVAVPRIASTVCTTLYPIPPATTPVGPTVVVPVIVQATACLEPEVFLVVVDAVIDAFIACIGWDAHMVADLKGVPPPFWAPPFECAALPPRSLLAIFNLATTAVALLVAGASRDLMCLAGASRCPFPSLVPETEAEVDNAAIATELTQDVIMEATCAAANVVQTVASSPIDIARAAAAISETLTGYNTAKAAASSAMYTVDLAEPAAAELRPGVVVVVVNYLVNVDECMQEAVEIATRRATYFNDFANKCMQAASLLARALEATAPP